MPDTGIESERKTAWKKDNELRLRDVEFWGVSGQTRWRCQQVLKNVRLKYSRHSILA